MKSVLVFCMALTVAVPAYSLEKLKPHPKPVPEVTLFKAYVFFKEILYVKLILPWWVDTIKAQQAAVYCDVCNYSMDSWYIYGCFVAMGDTKKIATLKRLLYSKTDEIVSKYLLKISLAQEFECPRCLDYCGWHVKAVEQEQESLS